MENSFQSVMTSPNSIEIPNHVAPVIPPRIHRDAPPIINFNSNPNPNPNSNPNPDFNTWPVSFSYPSNGFYRQPNQYSSFENR